MTADTRRGLPSVNALLESAAVRALLEHTPRAVVVEAIRRTLDVVRSSSAMAPADEQEWGRTVAAAVARAMQPSLRRVLNGTGVILHTNLGRAPLAQAAIDAIADVASGFSNLEYDLDAGGRGSRYAHCAALLRELTGAEDALVVNNCAAALVLVLDTLAHARAAIVSRGELIEIGGSFRIPEIMERSGVRLVEVGTTNRTHLDDYRRAVSAETGIIVKVHRSNFELSGYVADVSAPDVARFARDADLPFLHDLGSGLLVSLADFGLVGEPTAAEALRSGGSNTLVTMSGDKLLGGPQAGLILGARATVERIRKNPLTRSYRVDKLTLAALEATLMLYRDPAMALRNIPILAQITEPLSEVRARAERLARAIDSRAVGLTESDASIGGGAFPTAKLPSVALVLDGHAVAVEQRLRKGDPSVVARIAENRVLVDMRTILPSDERDLVAAIRAALS